MLLVYTALALHLHSFLFKIAALYLFVSLFPIRYNIGYCTRYGFTDSACKG